MLISCGLFPAHHPSHKDIFAVVHCVAVLLRYPQSFSHSFCAVPGLEPATTTLAVPVEVIQYSDNMAFGTVHVDHLAKACRCDPNALMRAFGFFRGDAEDDLLIVIGQAMKTRMSRHASFPALFAYRVLPCRLLITSVEPRNHSALNGRRKPFTSFLIIGLRARRTVLLVDYVRITTMNKVQWIELLEVPTAVCFGVQGEAESSLRQYSRAALHQKLASFWVG